jgi:hypothetical protein
MHERNSDKSKEFELTTYRVEVYGDEDGAE